MADRHAVRRPVLLTVSGAIPADLADNVAAGRRPEADYAVMRDAFDADLIDVPAALSATGRVGRLIHRVGGTAAILGWFCFRRRNDYDVIVTDGEQVGLPFALLSRVFGKGSAKHMMIVHIISVAKKAQLIRFTRIAGLIDRYVVYCSWQGDFIRDRLGVDAERVLLSTFMVDSAFFDPAAVDVSARRMICSAGLERRDYPTLIEAVDGLDVDVVIAAASPWSKRDDSTDGQELPDNVEIRRLDLFELRELYAAAAFVVMPLDDVEFQAGITTILEAMSMAKPVVCTRTPGQTDTIIDDVTGRYVAQGDVPALRSAISTLLAEPDTTARLGQAARDWILENADVHRYAERLATEVAALSASS